MAKGMVWSEEQGKMVEVGSTKGEAVKVSIDAESVGSLKLFTIEDGFDFSGVSYVTQKDKAGKTIIKDGKPLFELDDKGKPKKIDVEVSVAKVNSAISQYANVAVKKLIAERQAKAKQS